MHCNRRGIIHLGRSALIDHLRAACDADSSSIFRDVARAAVRAEVEVEGWNVRSDESCRRLADLQSAQDPGPRKTMQFSRRTIP